MTWPYYWLDYLIGMLNFIFLDVKVPGDGSIPDRAEKTLPRELSLAPTTTGEKTVNGVFAGIHLRKGTTFGPYEGEIVVDLEKSKETR